MTKQGRRRTAKQKKAEAQAAEEHAERAREIEGEFTKRRQEILDESRSRAHLVRVEAAGKAKEVSDRWAAAKQRVTDQAVQMEKDAKKAHGDTIKKAKRDLKSELGRIAHWKQVEHSKIQSEKKAELDSAEDHIADGDAEIEKWANDQLAIAEQAKLEELSVLDAEMQLGE